jgi:hypothetical protein
MVDAFRPAHSQTPFKSVVPNNSQSIRQSNPSTVALGRRNWIHVGGTEAGPRVAAIISVVATCWRLKIPVRAYLGSVLPGLSDFAISRIAELTPAAWAARN